jgi:acyl-CoA synthetase (AMP-forming)/AMP-acid ligase II
MMMMKTKVAMAISIAGVLAAGSAAALVNTQVLSGPSSPSFVSVADAPQAPLTTSAAAVASTTPAVAAASGIESPAAVGSTTQAVYAIGASGTVTLDTAGDVLAIVAVTPGDGWTVTKSEMHQPTSVEVTFQSGSTEVDFHANLLLGVVTTSVESHDGSSTNTSVDASGSRHGSDDTGDDHGGDDD